MAAVKYFAIALVAFCVLASASSASAYTTFNAGLKAQPNMKTVQQLVSKLGITSYFNSPNLALTVFTPSDKVSTVMFV
eukprot:jgi/Chrzof1/5980/UNPLg00825.t1